MVTIGIGISTYNDYISTNNLITSIKQFTSGEINKDYKIVVVDDGTKNQGVIDNLKDVCKTHGVAFSQNSENRGIPFTWNRLVDYCNTDIVVLFNNDIFVVNKDWLKHIEYFLTRNENIGTVGFPLIDLQQRYDERSWGDRPGHVGAPVGCCFGFKKDVWQQVKNPDGSVGFYEDLVSFHEETQMGFELSKLGYYNYMLNWPPMIHLGSQTFSKNHELAERHIDWSKWNKQEYINVITRSNIYPDHWKNNRIAWVNSKGIETVDRMAFSRYIFAKYWDVLSDYDNPAIPVHKRVVDTMPKRGIKWLDKNMKECEI